MTKFRTAYSGHERVSLSIDEGENRAKEAFAQESDINFILANYQRTGALEHLAKYGPVYGDVPAIDFQQAMEIVADAQTMFEELPARVRERFANNPGAFLEFVQDAKNLPEMRELGLARPEGVGVKEVSDGAEATEEASPAQ